MTIEYKDLQLADAGVREYAAYNRLMNRIRGEWYPQDPPFTQDDERRALHSTPAFVEVHHWGAWNGGESMVASASAFVTREETNQHVVFGLVNVLPEYRRQGVGRQLLATVASLARREGRRLLFFESYDTAPSGEAFMRRLEARVGMKESMSSLDVSRLDRAMLRRWVDEGERGAAGFALEFREGLAADANLVEVAELWNVMNTAPREQMEWEDTIMTPEKLMELERSVETRDGVHWMLLARHRGSGRLAGFTETVWLRNRPTLLEQWGTGVQPEFRNHGLGRWLKAAMLERVLNARPQVRFVRTENAGSNAPMLKINIELGFRLYVTRTLWQIETQRVLDYCASHGL